MAAIFAFNMDTQAIERVLGYGKEAIAGNPELFIEFADVYKNSFGFQTPEICATCPDGFSSAFDYMEIKYKQLKPLQKPKHMSQSKFTLKEGMTVHVPSEHKFYNNVTLTDDAACSLLALTENHVNSFTKLPDNWKEMVEDWKEKQLKAARKKNADASKEEADKLATGAYEGKNMVQLQELATERNLPKEEWGSFKAKKDIIAYMISKEVPATKPGEGTGSSTEDQD